MLGKRSIVCHFRMFCPFSFSILLLIQSSGKKILLICLLSIMKCPEALLAKTYREEKHFHFSSGKTNNCCASTENIIFLAIRYLATGHWKCIGRTCGEMLEYGCCSFPQIFMVSMVQQSCSENTSMSENHRMLWILCVSKGIQ